MKKITLWLFALFTCWQMSAQVGGYIFTEGVSSYAALGGTNITATGDDGTQNTLPIGFTFKFGGTDYTTFGITTNGFIRFGDIPGSAWTNNATNFVAAGFRPLIAAMWDDNNRNSGAITYAVSGVAPNQILTIDYNNVNIGGFGSTSGTNLASFQIKLFETTNVIEFHYGSLATAGPLSATIGLSDVSGFQSVTPGAPGISSNVTGNHGISVVTDIANKMYRFTPSACSAPGGLNATSVTSSSATINWNAVVPAPTGYEYVYSTTNSTPAGSGTPTTNVSEPLTLLSPQTVYYVFVRTNCGGTFSAWTSFSFTTDCVPITTFPNVEPLNTFLPNPCWSQGNGGDLTAGPNTTGPTGTWYADGLGNVGSTGAANYNLYQTGGNDWIISPQYTIPATGYELKFDAAITNYGSTTAPTNWDALDTVEVLVSTTGMTNWTPLFTYDVSNYSSVLPSGSLNVLDLDAYNGQTVRFAIRAFEGAAGRDIDFSFDNFTVRLSPTCPDQTGLVVSNVTAFTADSSWDDMSAGGSIGYEYAITTSATPPASGTPIGATFYSASGLNAQTVYYLHVRSVCSGSTYGNWATTTFTTGCAPITTLPHLEPFNTFLPNACWMNGVNGDLTAGPAAFTASGWGADGLANNGTTGAIRNNIYTTGANDWVISPEFTIPATGYELKFDAAAVQYGLTTAPTSPWGADDAIEVLVSSTGTTNWTLLHSYNDTNQPGITATPLALDLDAYATQTVRFAFRAVEGPTGGPADIDFSIDNFEVRLSPTCPDQTGLVVSNVTAFTADTSWDDMSGGGSIGYEYAITTSATPPASGTPIGATFYMASGLNAQTVYYLHVRSVCSGSTYGNWSTTTFTTQCAPIASLPWIETFETVTTPALPQCWLEQNGDWDTTNATTYNNAHGGTKYLRNAWFATNEFMWTPGFDLVAGTSYDFSSWVQGDGDVSWTVDFFVNNTQNSTGATQLGGQYVVPGTGTFAIQPYAQVTRSFVPATSGTYYFAIRVNESTGNPWYIAFDDVELKLSPACPTPSASASNVTSGSADVNWAAVPTATLGYEYVLDNVATDPAGSGTSTMALTYSNASLAPSTTYYFHIRSVCAVGTYSTWSTVSFTTPAAPPVNDNLCNATALTVGTPTGLTNTLVAATSQTSEPVAGCFVGGINGSVWFSFVAPTSGSVEITTDFAGGTLEDGDTEMAVYAATGVTCADLTTLGTALGCDQDGGTTVDFSSFLSLTGLTAGNTYYIQVDKYGAIASGTFGIQVTEVLGSDSFDTDSFVAYPNPVKDVLNLSYKTSISNVRVVNMLGQDVLKSNVTGNDVQINMSSLAAGAYIVNITVEDTVHTIKVIKE